MQRLIKNPVYMVQDILKNVVEKGDTVVDATCGNGYDTVFLARLVGEEGKVYAFDVQSQAIETTKDRLRENGLLENVILINEGHQYMDRFVEGPIACAMFNLGYLPGSDHKVMTNWENTVTALSKAMELLKQGGLITVIIYYGKDTGYEEKDKVLAYLSGIDSNRYTVLKLDFYNRINDPPIPILIEKL